MIESGETIYVLTYHEIGSRQDRIVGAYRSWVHAMDQVPDADQWSGGRDVRWATTPDGIYEIHMTTLYREA